jgi:hypothetical protein
MRSQHDLAQVLGQELGIGAVLLGRLPREEECRCQQGFAWLSFLT